MREENVKAIILQFSNHTPLVKELENKIPLLSTEIYLKRYLRFYFTTVKEFEVFKKAYDSFTTNRYTMLHWCLNYSKLQGQGISFTVLPEENVPLTTPLSIDLPIFSRHFFFGYNNYKLVSPNRIEEYLNFIGNPERFKYLNVEVFPKLDTLSDEGLRNFFKNHYIGNIYDEDSNVIWKWNGDSLSGQ